MYLLIWDGGKEMQSFQHPEEATEFQVMRSIEDGQVVKINFEPVHPNTTFVTKLLRIMYISRATDPENCTPKHLEEMAHSFSIRNKALGVTGFLFYSAPFFFQAIEGNEHDVLWLYQKISKDRGHTDVVLVAKFPCSARMYGVWSMKGSHICDIVPPIALKTIFLQLVNAASSTWSYLPRHSADLLLQGMEPNEQPPELLSVVHAFIYLVECDSMFEQRHVHKQCADVMTAFIDTCLTAVEKSGGMVANLMTGVCLAYWPIHRAEDALCAIQGINTQLAELRAAQPAGSALSLLHTRAAVHHGLALLCNAGTKKSNFTVLGECVNTCSRIGSVAAELKRPLLLSFEVRCLLSDDVREDLECLGAHQVKGRRQPVELYEFKGALELDGDKVKQQVAAFRRGNHQATRPIREYLSLPKGDRPPIFNRLPHKLASARDLLQESGSLPGHPILFSDGMADCRPDQLITLTYISIAAQGLSLTSLSSIQRAATRRNAKWGITSSLVNIGNLFMQFLEGPKAAVWTVYLKICADSRHTHVVTVHMGPIQTRVYPSHFQLITASEGGFRAFPPLRDVLTQLARSFISMETYVPSAVIRQLVGGTSPHESLPVSTEVLMFAADICSSTAISELLSLNEILLLWNTFIDACTTALAMAQGEVSKIIGDCVVAYFAPAQAKEALSCCKQVIGFCDELRKAISDSGGVDCRSMLYCGIGLDCGTAALAQCGTKGMTEYVVGGLVSARVVEVEAATRSEGYAIVLTEPFAQRLRPETRHFLLAPCAAAVRGVPCYGVVGADWALDMGVVGSAVEAFRDKTRTAGSDDRNGMVHRWPSAARLPQPESIFKWHPRRASSPLPRPPSCEEAPYDPRTEVPRAGSSSSVPRLTPTPPSSATTSLPFLQTEPSPLKRYLSARQPSDADVSHRELLTPDSVDSIEQCVSNIKMRLQELDSTRRVQMHPAQR